jgi:ketosteroid isomerase-like protein
MAEPNPELVRRGYDALAKHDTLAVPALLAENITWLINP